MPVPRVLLVPDPLRALQSLCFPLYLPAAVPLAGETPVASLATLVNALATTQFGQADDYLSFSLYIIAVTWVAAMLALALFVTASYSRLRCMNSLPVKVRPARGARFGSGWKGDPSFRR